MMKSGISHTAKWYKLRRSRTIDLCITMKGATQRNIPDTNTIEKRTRINSSSGLSTSLDNPDSIKIHFHLKKTKQQHIHILIMTVNLKAFNAINTYTLLIAKRIAINCRPVLNDMEKQTCAIFLTSIECKNNVFKWYSFAGFLGKCCLHCISCNKNHLKWF